VAGVDGAADDFDSGDFVGRDTQRLCCRLFQRFGRSGGSGRNGYVDCINHGCKYTEFCTQITQIIFVLRLLRTLQ
jgi:hypothetical protein